MVVILILIDWAQAKLGGVERCSGYAGGETAR
jgi:hypothetical protein